MSWIPQGTNLWPRRSIIDNVIISMLEGGRRRAECVAKAHSLLESVGIGPTISRHVKTLSGGQAQRVTIARAFANAPNILIAKEPTANLDLETSRSVMKALLNAASNTTVLIATHDPHIATMTDRIVMIEHKQVVDAHVALLRAFD